MQNEVELKLDLDSAAADAIEASGLHRRASAEQRLLSRYFDTPDLALRAAGISLRLREANGLCIQTVKADGPAGIGLFDRPEWEIPAPGAHPFFDPRTPIADLLGNRSRELVEQFVLSVKRRTWRIATRKGEIELALDRGTVRSLERSEQFCELELELIRGEPSALFKLAEGLGAVAPVRIGVLSKAARGYRLIGPQLTSVKSKAPQLDPAEDPATAFAAIVQHCIGHFRQNEAILLEIHSVEAVHQARIALRRLRSALSLFRDILPKPETRKFQDRLRALAATLGDVRDLDLLCALAEPGPMVQQLEAARDEARARLAATLAGEEARRLMLDLVSWLFCGAWRLELAGAAMRKTSLNEFAGHAFERAYRQVKKHSRHLARLEPDARHELRKDSKKLRYAIEFMASLFDFREQKRQRKRFVAAFTALLDSLGALNDHKVAETRLAQIGLADSETARTLLAHWNEPRLLAEAGDARERLLALKPFWH